MALNFTKSLIADEKFESAGVFDVNNDGVLDIVSGSWWYEGPDFKKRHFIGEIQAVDEYFDDFATVPIDVNGDTTAEVVDIADALDINCVGPTPPTDTPTRTPTATDTPRPPGPVGDVTCDGLVNSIDAALVLQYDAGLIDSLSCAQNADVNVDGAVNSIDAALILQYDARLIDRLPPP